MARILVRGFPAHSLVPYTKTTARPISLHREPLLYAKNSSIVPPPTMQTPIFSSSFVPPSTVQAPSLSPSVKAPRPSVPAIFPTARACLSSYFSTQSLPVTSTQHTDATSFSSSSSPMISANPSTVLPTATIVPHSSFVSYVITVPTTEFAFYLTIL